MLGDPIAHSLSPVLHRAGYAATGLPWEYDAHRVPRVGCGFLAGLDATGAGCRSPCRSSGRPLDLLDDPVGTAPVWRSGPSNTLMLGEPPFGRQHRRAGCRPPRSAERTSRRSDGATILGGGATATSVGLALADRGAGGLTLLVRDIDRAGRPSSGCAATRRRPLVQVLPLGDWEATGDVVVSTIPVSAQDDDLVARCADVPAVFEVVYDPWPTPLAVAAAARGQVLVSGLDLLVHQAALQFALFTGVPAPVADDAGGGRTGAERAGGVMEVVPALVAAVLCGLAGLAAPGSSRGSRSSAPDPEADRTCRTTTPRRPTPRSPPCPASPGSPRSCPLSPGGLIAGELGWAWPLVYLLPLVPVCVALAVVDWRTRLLPTKVIRPSYLLVVVGVLVCFAATRDTDDLVRAGWGLLVAFGLYWLLWRVYPRGMGFGDVRLSGVLGIALGQLGWGDR